METKKYLNEETYQKSKKKIIRIAILVLVIGVLIGGGLIANGIIKQCKVNSQYSEENKVKLTEKLETEKEKLINSKTELEAKIKPIQDEIKSLERESFTGFDDAYYARKDKIEELEKSIATDKNSISVIGEALDESFNYCKFDKAKNNSYTAKYCSIKIELNDITEFNKDFDSFDSIPFYMFGAFIIIASCIIAVPIYMFAKGRDIMAFTAQQTMPVAKEGLEDIAPTVGKVGASIAKEMAPVYGEVAKEISKGIKEGLKDDKE